MQKMVSIYTEDGLIRCCMIRALRDLVGGVLEENFCSLSQKIAGHMVAALFNPQDDDRIDNIEWKGRVLRGDVVFVALSDSGKPVDMPACVLRRLPEFIRHL